MSKNEQADKIVYSHVIWSLGAGLIPLPLFDLVAVTAIQMDMLKQLADLYEVDFSQSQGKVFISALTGSTFAKIGSSIIKAIPGVGILLGGVSVSAMSGASTYAVGQVVIMHLESGGKFMDVDVDSVKSTYEKAFEQGKEFVEGLKSKDKAGKDLQETLEMLARLQEKGIITEEEFEAKKKALLESISL